MAITKGSFVSWSSSGGSAKGKVVSIHKNGNVPNIDVKITGTADDPAARICVYKAAKDGYEPTDGNFIMTNSLHSSG